MPYRLNGGKSLCPFTKKSAETSPLNRFNFLRSWIIAALSVRLAVETASRVGSLFFTKKADIGNGAGS